MQCVLAEIITARGSLFNRDIVNPQTRAKSGLIIVRSEEVSNVNATVKFNIKAMHLDKKDWFGSSDPFLVISRSTENGDWHPVHTTEVHKNTLNVAWNPFEESAQKVRTTIL